MRALAARSPARMSPQSGGWLTVPPRPLGWTDARRPLRPTSLPEGLPPMGPSGEKGCGDVLLPSASRERPGGNSSGLKCMREIRKKKKRHPARCGRRLAHRTTERELGETRCFQVVPGITERRLRCTIGALHSVPVTVTDFTVTTLGSDHQHC